MVVDKIAGIVKTVVVETAKGVKGVVPEVLFGSLNVVNRVLNSTDITPKGLYEACVIGGKPFAKIGMKEQAIYYTFLAVTKALSEVVNTYESEKNDIQKELEELKLGKVDSRYSK